MGKVTAAFPPYTHPTILLHWLIRQHPELPPVFYIDVWYAFSDRFSCIFVSDVNPGRLLRLC